VRRFDANSYVVLTEAMNSHDIGRGRGGTAAALRRVTARTPWRPSTPTGSTRCP
jgi:homoserine O-acetyltransferase